MKNSLQKSKPLDEPLSLESDQVKRAFLFTISRNIVVLYKRYINLVEDLKEDHRSYVGKVSKEIGNQEFLKNIEYFDEEKYNYIRKKILDLGNESIREIENFSELVDINFKKNDKGQKDL